MKSKNTISMTDRMTISYFESRGTKYDFYVLNEDGSNVRKIGRVMGKHVYALGAKIETIEGLCIWASEAFSVAGHASDGGSPVILDKKDELLLLLPVCPDYTRS
jgi:hypothetical protein